MLLTVDEARLFVTTTLGDTALRLLLDASEEAIADQVGALAADDDMAPVVERHVVHGDLILLFQRAASITSVVEGTTTLAADDYSLASTGNALRRLDTGTNPASYWRSEAVVTYVPRGNIASRQNAQVQLVNLFLSYKPGVSSQTIGPWSEVYGQLKTLLGQRQDILSAIAGGAFEGIR